MRPIEFRGAVLKAPGNVNVEDLVYEDVPDTSVVVEISKTGVCRSQVMEYRGARGADPWLPHLFGHEAVGRVLGFGSKVMGYEPGDEVILTWLGSRGASFQAPVIKDQSDAVVNVGRIGTFCTVAVVDQNCVFKKPTLISNDLAVLFGCAIGTGAGLVLNSDLRPGNPGSSVAVWGLGGIGSAALITLVALGVTNVVAIDKDKKKLDFFSNNLGISCVEYEEAIAGGVLTKGFDYCFEATGSTDGIEQAFKSLNTFGQLIFASHPPDGECIHLKPHDLISGKSITGSWGGGVDPEKDFETLAEIFKDYEVLVKSFVGPFFPLGSVSAALESLESGGSFRPILECR